MRFPIPALVVAVVAAFALAGCGKSHPTSPGGSTGGTPDDFAALVQSSYVSGAVLPTTLEQAASLLITMDVETIPVGAALFRYGTTYVDAGTVAATSQANMDWTGSPPPGDTLARLSIPVYNTPWYVYSSAPNLPALLPLAFDGLAWHHFHVSGSPFFPAFTDSVRSVTRPAVSAPAAAASVPRSSSLGVTWSDAGSDSTVYMLCMVRSNVDTTRSALALLVRDASGGTSFPSAALLTLPAGAARLSVGRYRLARRTNGPLAVNLVCEATALRTLTLQ